MEKVEVEGDKIVAVMPAESSLRMMAQHSVFTIHSGNKPLEEIPKRCLFLTRVPAEQKAPLLKDLYCLGIRESALFPDLDSLARDLKHRFL
jgi:hypothetical protein